MKGLTESLWPIRYKPFPDELLTSWLVRLAWGHGLKVQTFCNQVFGGRHQVWNRDVDRLAPDWLVNELTARTGTPWPVAHGTTLRAYEGVLYSKFRASGSLPWIQTLKMYHRQRQGFGLQYCSACLAEDERPYYRKSWRVSFNTICTRHLVMLRDRCPQCEAPVMFHRLEMGRSSFIEAGTMGSCHACGFALAESPRQPIWAYDDHARGVHIGMCRAITEQNPHAVDPDALRVLHHFVHLMLSRYSTVSLREHLCGELQVQDLVEVSGKMHVETLPLVQRHHLVQLGAWLMGDLQERMSVAWRSRALRYNHMEKDFDDPPFWYRNVVGQFSNWRMRLTTC
jgi:hypothetical protein